MADVNTLDGLKYEERTKEQWSALPVVECACGQKFYQQVQGEKECDDCISCDDAKWAVYAPITRQQFTVVK